MWKWRKKFKVGDIVGRKSHGSDILFRIAEIENSRDEERVLLRGLDVRLLADASIEDLEKRLLQKSAGIGRST